MHKDGVGPSAIARELGISRMSVHRALKRRLVAPYQGGCILCTSLGSPTRCYP